MPRTHHENSLPLYARRLYRSSSPSPQTERMEAVGPRGRFSVPVYLHKSRATDRATDPPPLPQRSAFAGLAVVWMLLLFVFPRMRIQYVFKRNPYLNQESTVEVSEEGILNENPNMRSQRNVCSSGGQKTTICSWSTLLQTSSSCCPSARSPLGKRTRSAICCGASCQASSSPRDCRRYNQ